MLISEFELLNRHSDFVMWGIGYEKQWLYVVACTIDFYACMEFMPVLQPLAFKKSNFYTRYSLLKDFKHRRQAFLQLQPVNVRHRI